MPHLRLVIGANGAGKSTWCRRTYREELPAAFYDADSIAQGLGSYDDPEKQREARELVNGHIEKHLERRETFGFESTYSGASRPDIVRRAHSLGYEVSAVFVGTHSAEINVERVAWRVKRQVGHDVPTDEIVRRWTAAQDNLLKTASMFNEIQLLDNSEERLRLAVHLSGRRVIERVEPVPPWAKKLAAAIQRGRTTIGERDGPGHPR